MKITEKNQSIKFDYLIDNKPKEVATIDGAGAECVKENYYKGTRTEMRDYIQLTNPELYNKVFVYTVNGKTRDWFGALSSDFIYSALKSYGFTWENVVKTIVIKDGKNSKNLDENY